MPDVINQVENAAFEFDKGRLTGEKGPNRPNKNVTQQKQYQHPKYPGAPMIKFDWKHLHGKWGLPH